MKTNFKSLLSTIMELQLGYRRVNDLEVGKGVYHLEIVKFNDDERVCLVGDDKVQYPVSVAQLASLRCTEDMKSVKAEWLDDFHKDPNGMTFQAFAAKETADLENMIFKVVGQLKIRNHSVNEENVPVYQDRYYTGSNEYIREIRNLLKGKERSFFATPEYRYGVRELRDRLYQTSVREGKDVPENVVKLPIFTVTSK